MVLPEFPNFGIEFCATRRVAVGKTHPRKTMDDIPFIAIVLYRVPGTRWSTRADTIRDCMTFLC